jgi:arylsulfatase A-like enzyme
MLISFAMTAIAPTASPSPRHRTGRHRRPGRLAAALLLAAGCLAGCGGKPPQPSFILVSLDATRADHLGAYGYERDTTPFVDSLARRGFLFEQAVAPSLNTLISHASLLTGLPAWGHGATYGEGGRPLHPHFTSVAEELAAAGYRTAAFAAHGDWLTPELGFGQGFDVFSSDYRSADAVLAEAAAWLGEVPATTPYFLFLHLYDVHSDYEGRPYGAPEPFAGRWAKPGWEESLVGSDYLAAVNDGELEIGPAEVARLVDQYDEGLAYTDDRLGAFFAGFDAARLERAWTVVVADHGEAFLEHGKLMHVTLHDEVVRVPFIFVPPPASPYAERAPARLRGQVALVDVRPTLLSLAGLPAPRDCLGVDLLPCLPGGEGSCGERPATMFRSGLRHAGYKLLRVPTGSRLYDLKADPGETDDLAGRPETWELQRKMQRLLTRLIDEQETLQERVVAGVEIEAPAPDAEAEERLRALGYLD